MDKTEQFIRAWQIKYHKLLTLKKDFLEEFILLKSEGKNTEKIEINLELVGCQIELALVEQAIYYGENPITIGNQDLKPNNTTIPRGDVN